jgi:hypothetical protein
MQAWQRLAPDLDGSFDELKALVPQLTHIEMSVVSNLQKN